jgi:hypothetical protein
MRRYSLTGTLLQYCERCKKAKFTCLGYEVNGNVIFRADRYSSNGQSGGSHSISSQAQIQAQVGDGDEPDDRSDSLSQQEPNISEDYLFGIFFQDYCITPRDASMSRGYLSELPNLVKTFGSTSNIAQAAKTVALASLGNLVKKPIFLETAKLSYSRVLQTLRTTILDSNPEIIYQNFMVAVLLGLYEVSLQECFRFQSLLLFLL